MKPWFPLVPPTSLYINNSFPLILFYDYIIRLIIIHTLYVLYTWYLIQNNQNIFLSLVFLTFFYLSIYLSIYLSVYLSILKLNTNLSLSCTSLGTQRCQGNSSYSRRLPALERLYLEAKFLLLKSIH